MIGIVFLIYFLVCGWMISRRVFAKESTLIGSWIGILFGLTGMMWGVVLFSFVFDFTYLSHACAAVLMALAVGLTVCGIPQHNLTHPNKSSPAILLAITLFFIPIAALMLSRTFNYNNGDIYAGLPNFSDLPFHLGMVTGLVERKAFPPEYSIFAGVKTAYPFLVNGLSASLYLFGLPLKWSVLLPNLILAWTLVTGFLMLARAVVQKTSAVVVAALLFFFHGGFGFAYFLEGSKAQPEIFTRILQNSMYPTPSMWWENNLFLGNLICTHIINVRTSLIGWSFLLFFMWLLYRAVTSKEPRFFFVAGTIGGLLPMIHAVSFLSAVFIAGVWLTVYFATAADQKKYGRGCLLFAVPFLVLALPQLFYWIFPHGAAAGGKFMSFHFDWANKTDTWLWFWIKNAGVVFLFLTPALLSANRTKLFFYGPAVVLFLFGDFFQMSQMDYDNNKIFLIWFMFSAVIVADFLTDVYRRMKGIRGREIFLGIWILVGILSAGMTLVHDFKTVHQVFSKEDLEVAAFIRQNTPPDAVFISSDFHNNPITALAGRRILAGYVGWMMSFGLDYEKRFKDIRKMYTSPEDFPRLRHKYEIDYVYFSGRERSNYKTSPEYFDQNFPKIFSNKHVSIYAVSPEAQRYARTRP